SEILSISLHDALPISFAFKTIAATKDEFVPMSSSLDPFPKKYQEVIEGNHFSIVQITNVENDGYRIILNTLTNQGFLNKFSNKEDRKSTRLNSSHVKI